MAKSFPVDVARFVAEDADAVFALVTRIQNEEHGGADSEADAADLRSVATTYVGTASGFWVAKQNGSVIGTAALIDLGGGDAMLKRMYVDRNFRGPQTGTARRLLRHVVAWAKQQGIACIVLGTMAEPAAAPRFYEKSGFLRIDPSDMPANSPISDVDDRFYRLDLTKVMNAEFLPPPRSRL